MILDLLPKGYHVNSDIGELTLKPRVESIEKWVLDPITGKPVLTLERQIHIDVLPAGVTTGNITQEARIGVRELITNDPAGGYNRAYNGIVRQFGYLTEPAGWLERIQEAKWLAEVFNGEVPWKIVGLK